MVFLYYVHTQREIPTVRLVSTILLPGPVQPGSDRGEDAICHAPGFRGTSGWQGCRDQSGARSRAGRENRS